jgi:hypothetical protein
MGKNCRTIDGEYDVRIYSLSNCTGELKRRRTRFLQEESKSPGRAEIRIVFSRIKTE